MIRAVVFDMDGTLIDSVDGHAESWVRAFAQFGIETRFETSAAISAKEQTG